MLAVRFVRRQRRGGLLIISEGAGGNLKKYFLNLSLNLNLSLDFGGPNGIRTRVLALRGPRPRPLDDGTITTGVSDWGLEIGAILVLFLLIPNY